MQQTLEPAEGRRAVLVVDDVGPTRTGLAELLRLRGYAVYEARNGAEALEQLQEHADICVVVLDLRMPDTDGFWFRERQLQDGALAHIPVIVFTGVTKGALQEELGVSTVLLKPFSVDQLIAAISGYCD